MEPEPNPIRPCDNPAINPEKPILIKVNLLESWNGYWKDMDL